MTKGLLLYLPSVSWIAGSHHVLSIKHLLGQFWYGQRSVKNNRNNH